MQPKKHSIIQDENLHLSCEYSPHVPTLLVIHCDIFNWSHSLYKKYILLWEKIRSDMKVQGIKTLGIIVPEDDIKLMKFATMFGFNVESDTYYENKPAILLIMDVGE